MVSSRDLFSSIHSNSGPTVQMGTIKAKDQALAMGVSNASKGKQKAKNSKQSDKRKPGKPKTNDGGSNPPKENEKKGKDKNKCTYFHKR